MLRGESRSKRIRALLFHRRKPGPRVPGYKQGLQGRGGSLTRPQQVSDPANPGYRDQQAPGPPAKRMGGAQPGAPPRLPQSVPPPPPPPQPRCWCATAATAPRRRDQASAADPAVRCAGLSPEQSRQPLAVACLFAAARGRPLGCSRPFVSALSASRPGPRRRMSFRFGAETAIERVKQCDEPRAVLE